MIKIVNLSQSYKQKCMQFIRHHQFHLKNAEKIGQAIVLYNSRKFLELGKFLIDNRFDMNDNAGIDILTHVARNYAHNLESRVKILENGGVIENLVACRKAEKIDIAPSEILDNYEILKNYVTHAFKQTSSKYPVSRVIEFYVDSVKALMILKNLEMVKTLEDNLILMQENGLLPKDRYIINPFSSKNTLTYEEGVLELFISINRRYETKKIRSGKLLKIMIKTPNVWEECERYFVEGTPLERPTPPNDLLSEVCHETISPHQTYH